MKKQKNTPDRANRTKPKTPRKISERYLYNAGLHYLKRYTASVAHFKRIMTRKIDKSLKHHNEPSQEECLKLLQGITEKMIELGFLNDDQYTIGMVTSLRKRGASGGTSLAKLSQKAWIKNSSSVRLKALITPANLAMKTPTPTIKLPLSLPVKNV